MVHLWYLNPVKGHKTMVANQAYMAVVHTICTVTAQEAPITTTASAGCSLQSFLTIMPKHFIKVSLSVYKPFIHNLCSGSLFRVLCCIQIFIIGIIILSEHVRLVHLFRK